MGEVFRGFVEKKPGFDGAARALCRELTDAVGIQGLTGLRLLNRYDVENIDPQVYERAKTVVFSEPQADVIWDETFPQPRNAHSLLADGAPVKLTPTETRIMELFMKNPGRIFSAEEIYARVWNEAAAYAPENTVMVHIRRIREKIELNPKEPEYLKVVWGLGYRLEKK